MVICTLFHLLLYIFIKNDRTDSLLYQEVSVIIIVNCVVTYQLLVMYFVFVRD